MRCLAIIFTIIFGVPFLFSCDNNNWEEITLYSYGDDNDSINDTVHSFTRSDNDPNYDPSSNNIDSNRIFLKIEKYMEQDAAHISFFQGASCYEDYLFQFYSYNYYVYVYNLKEKKYLGEVKLVAKSKNHCSNASFSNIFYEEGDDFPLIYVSGSTISDYNHVQVYRIQKKEQEFIVSSIQEITLPEGNSDNGLLWTGVAMDNESNYMYVYANNSDSARIYKLPIPDIHKKDIIFQEKDILDIFPVEKFSHQQGAVIKNGILYVIDGVPAKGDTNCLRLFDLKNRKQYKYFSLEKTPLRSPEPEGLTFWGDTLIATTNYGYGIYTIRFLKK